VKARLQRLSFDRPMRILLSRVKATDPNFAIGLTLIVTLAGAEIFAATFYYLNRIRTARISGQSITIVSAGRPAPSPIAAEQRSKSEPPTKPSPAPSAVDRLLQEAIELRDRGDTATALARLNEASELDPTNAMVLEETAKTYESMQRFDRSNETWRKLRDLGPSAGPLYELADRRLNFGVPISGAPGSGSATESPDAAPSPTESGGVREDPTFGISEINATDTPDPDAEKNLTLRIGIKKQTNAAIDHNKVRILVKFYDTVNDAEIKLTDADVNYEWLTAKHDWADANPEILSVNYLRPKARASSPDTEPSETAAAVKSRKGRSANSGSSSSEKRKYLGYEIFVYYNDKLQAAQAEPARLLQIYPPSEGVSSR
jgi:tetratricopeptide (TPR) repeat protein